MEFMGRNYRELKQAPDLEMDWAHDGLNLVPGYLVECEDNSIYLAFAPDLPSLKHMNTYCKLIKHVKYRVSDHDYDPLRQCIRPALTEETEADGTYKQLYAPSSEIGKVYKVK